MENKDLKKLKKELETQDNAGTDCPLYVVYDWEKVQSDDGDDYEWKGEDWENCDENNILDELEEKYGAEVNDLNFDEYAEKEGYTKWHYKKIRTFVNAFLTQKSAKQFIKQNKYHWNEPHIYVHALWRNYELKEIREALLKGELKNVERK